MRWQVYTRRPAGRRCEAVVLVVWRSDGAVFVQMHVMAACWGGCEQEAAGMAVWFAGTASMVLVLAPLVAGWSGGSAGVALCVWHLYAFDMTCPADRAVGVRVYVDMHSCHMPRWLTGGASFDRAAPLVRCALRALCVQYSLWWWWPWHCGLIACISGHVCIVSLSWEQPSWCHNACVSTICLV